MKNSFYKILAIAFLLCNAVLCDSQTLSGFILDEENNPVPFANVLIPELDLATNSNSEGKYSLNVFPGNYTVIISCVGYAEKKVLVDLTDGENTKNIYIKFSSEELEEAVVKASGRDPAYEIMNKASEKRRLYLKQLNSYKTHVYLKATEEKIIKERPQKKDENEVLLEGEEPGEELEIKEDTPEPLISFLEIDLDLSFQLPNNYKQVRTAYQCYGNQNSFFIPQFSEANFNFYESLVELTNISDVPLISPLSGTAVLSYKFKLIHTHFENGRKVYEIAITPRKKGNATMKGIIFVNDKLFNINRIELELASDALKFFDDMHLSQSYEMISDSVWICNAQEFTYRSKANKYKIFEGKTTLKYTDFQPEYEFPNKYFSSEIGVTTKEAYERDSTYWEKLRPKPLSKIEQELVHTTDSIKAYHKSPEYLDSIQTIRNKISVGKVLIHGVDFWNYQKKQRIYINSLIDFLDYSIVDGLRLGPGFNYSRRYDDNKYFGTGAYANVGLKTGRVNGNVNFRLLTNPIKNAWTQGSFRRNFVSQNPGGAYLAQAQLANYISDERLHFTHRREIVNGLYLWANVAWRNRQPIGKWSDPSDFLEEYVTQEGELEFTPHQAFITTFAIDFVPFQRYMSEPNRKIIIGSNYPEFFFNYIKGWNGTFSSDVDFDRIVFGMTQKVTLGTLGYTKYRISSGKFLNDKELYDMDKTWIRRSDPFLFSEPLTSFQFLDSARITTNWYVMAHHLHHFNGVLVNNIPLIKKLKLRTVAGVSFLWMQDDNYRREEFIGGVERVFKIGARRRLKLGVYGVLANSNDAKANTGFKIALDIIDTWQKDWSF